MNRRNFFISYSGIDHKWAEWIGYALEEVGYTIFLQAWDISPGHNFILKMHEAAQNCERMIVVMSRSYLTSMYAKPEWAQAFANDPISEERLIIPVRVESCDFKGILKPIVWVDLVDCEENKALTLLLEGVSQERRKPFNRPLFPGNNRDEFEIISKPAFPPSEKSFDRGRLPKNDPSSLSIQAGEHFLDELPHFLNRNPKYMSIAFFDIDGQGAINRKYGRAVGDKVIENVAKLLKQYLYDDYTLHRCGDDTFFTLLPYNVEIGLEHIKIVLQEIRSFPWSLKLAEGLSVFCSASIAEFQGKSSGNEINIHETVIRAAVGCRSARILGGNQAQKGPVTVTSIESVLMRALSQKVKNIHS